MHPLLIVVVTAIGSTLIFLGVRAARRANSNARVPNPIGLVLIAVGAGLLVLRMAAAAIPLIILGTALLLRRPAGMSGTPSVRTSKVRSDHLEMTLDHETGSIDGEVLTGQREGQVLSTLALDELLLLHVEFDMDEESTKLLETYLDSRHPDWRDHKNESSAHSGETSPSSRQLSRDEAYRLLGLEAGCSEEEIRSAYHRIIKRVHPDSGGSAALTAQITEARDLLLGDGS